MNMVMIMNMNIKIKQISLDDVIANDKVRYNTSNHWENGIKPENYDENIKNTYTNKWIDKWNDESEDMSERYTKKYGKIFDGKSYFIRTDNVSLKEGKHGVGPYKDFKTIIESIVTCR